MIRYPGQSDAEIGQFVVKVIVGLYRETSHRLHMEIGWDAQREKNYENFRVKLQDS